MWKKTGVKKRPSGEKTYRRRKGPGLKRLGCDRPSLEKTYGEVDRSGRDRVVPRKRPGRKAGWKRPGGRDLALKNHT